MKYILDFDDTLYDAKSFKELVARDGANSLLFTPEIWQHYDVRTYLHIDTLDWLRQKSKDDLFILTAAMTSDGKTVMEYQKEKLRCSKLGDMVSDIIFSEGDKGVDAASIAKQFPPDETIVFVDDKIEQCLSVQSAVPQAIVCLMVRDPEQIGNVDSVRGIHVVHTLADVDGIIEKL